MMPTAHSAVYPLWRLAESVWRLAEVEWVAEVEQDSHRPGVHNHRWRCCASVNGEACGNV